MLNSYITNLSSPQQRIALVLIAVWTLSWKGLALWRAAKKENKYWFVALLVLNTAGLLEIAYLVFFSKGEVKFKGIKSPSKKGNKK